MIGLPRLGSIVTTVKDKESDFHYDVFVYSDFWNVVDKFSYPSCALVVAHEFPKHTFTFDNALEYKNNYVKIIAPSGTVGYVNVLHLVNVCVW